MSDQQDPSTVNSQDAGAPPEGAVASPSPGSSGQSDQSIDWKARFDGANRVLALRDKKIAELEAQLAASGQSVEDLQGQLNAQVTALETRLTGLTEQLTGVTQERDAKATELSALTAYRVKMEALKAYPDLLPLADTIPDLPDEALMKEHLAMLAKSVEEVASAKARQLSAGMVPGPTAPNAQPRYSYSTEAEWAQAMNAAAGGEDFARISDAYLAWVNRKP